MCRYALFLQAQSHFSKCPCHKTLVDTNLCTMHMCSIGFLQFAYTLIMIYQMVQYIVIHMTIHGVNRIYLWYAYRHTGDTTPTTLPYILIIHNTDDNLLDNSKMVMVSMRLRKQIITLHNDYCFTSNSISL